MTGDASKFSSIKFKNKGKVSFGDNSQGSIIGYGSILVEPNLFLSKVLLVEGLKHNLLSVSQLCDNGYLVQFHSTKCIIKHIESNSTILVSSRDENVYTIDLPITTNNFVKCLMSKEEEAWLWHRRMTHSNMKLLSKLSKYDHVDGLPKVKYEKNKLCDACQEGKQTRCSHKAKELVSSSQPLELLHLDLLDSHRVVSIGSSRYVLVIVDDYSRFSWTLFLGHKMILLKDLLFL
ncbi:Retrovirus-related Pol polyprotein from transposon TNT 1-94 [Apostasia shenzhenica]|uniref:Retrovirus-related Pol polyprotein from transposon TNT 1-94 n=1 Tax=Apostasia shenzhenica TaxID=1088818 RepID=A0A2I0A2X5_9ASPA|nr:Retrovirus-related Pol polyprotein from transposon TNT 1-94 [Apostasia shenzhenica]